jgi:hypothetical protein
MVCIPKPPRPPQRSPVSPMATNGVQSPYVPTPRIPFPAGEYPPQRPK